MFYHRKKNCSILVFFRYKNLLKDTTRKIIFQIFSKKIWTGSFQRINTWMCSGYSKLHHYLCHLIAILLRTKNKIQNRHKKDPLSPITVALNASEAVFTVTVRKTKRVYRDHLWGLRISYDDLNIFATTLILTLNHCTILFQQRKAHWTLQINQDEKSI